MELVTGRKAVDINRPKGEQCLTEWVHMSGKKSYLQNLVCFNHLSFNISSYIYEQARPLLEENSLSKYIDPCLKECYLEREVEAMLHCALLCLQRDPQSRPTMSQVNKTSYVLLL